MESGSTMNSGTTTGSLLKGKSESWGDRVWMRKKQSGLWYEYTWRDCYNRIRQFALGMKELGLGRGVSLAILGDNDPQWFWIELAVQALGGTAVAVSADCQAEQVKEIVGERGCHFIAVQDQEQVDKLLEVQDQLPELRKVVFWYGRGLEHYDDPILVSFDHVLELGQACEDRSPGVFEQCIAETGEQQLALVLTDDRSGGQSQQANLTHADLCASNAGFRSASPVYPTDNWLSFLPPGWAVEQIMALMSSLIAGMVINFPERPETVQQDMREIGPTLVFYPASVWENLVSDALSNMNGSTLAKRVLCRLLLPIGYRVAGIRLNGETPGLLWKGLHGLSRVMLFRPLKARLALGNTRYAFSSGPAVGTDVSQLAAAMGLDLRQIQISGGVLGWEFKD